MDNMIAFRVNSGLKNEIKLIAKEEGRSISNMCRLLFQKGVQKMLEEVN